MSRRLLKQPPHLAAQQAAASSHAHHLPVSQPGSHTPPLTRTARRPATLRPVAIPVTTAVAKPIAATLPPFLAIAAPTLPPIVVVTVSKAAAAAPPSKVVLVPAAKTAAKAAAAAAAKAAAALGLRHLHVMPSVRQSGRGGQDGGAGR